MVHKVIILLHLVGFAAYLGAGFAQQQFMTRSARVGFEPDLRDEYERLAASIVTSIELPALFVQVATGVVLVVMAPIWIHQGWLHAKLVCVAVLLVLSHLEMINARKLVKARAERGDTARDEIASRKAWHGRYGLLGTAALVTLVALVAYGTG
jgi:protoporphyrinogen IX oxidase